MTPVNPTLRRHSHPHYDFRKIDSYPAMIKIVVGGRGLGKTYGGKKKGIKAGIRAKKVMLDGRLNSTRQFMYVRRTVEELKAAKVTFFSDIAGEFPNHDLRIEGSLGMASERVKRKPGEEDKDFKRRVKERKWFVICHFKALSVAQQQKSTSFTYVTVMIFDEFIIEDSAQNHYLKKEVEALINLYNTVDRAQDKTTLFLFANSVSIMNPYFSYFKIRPDQLEEISIHAGGNIVCHFPDSADYQQSIYATRFGKFIKDYMPEYAEYAVGNAFGDSHNTLVGNKTPEAKYKYTVETSEGSFSVWYDRHIGTYFILAFRPGNERILTFVAANMGKGKIFVNYNEPLIKTLRYSFNHGKVIFDEPATRNAFVPIFDRS